MGNPPPGRIFSFFGYIMTGACLSRVEYAYTTGELGEPLNTVAYGYDDTLGWKDLLTSYDGQARLCYFSVYKSNKLSFNG